MKNIFLSICLLLSAFTAACAQEYKTAIFGIKNDGVTDNTSSIQKAVDIIASKGGGTLVFYVGRYLTGAVCIPEAVTIKLEEGAVLVASSNIYSYSGAPALLWSSSKAALEGTGSILSCSDALKQNLLTQKNKGYLPANKEVPSVVSNVRIGKGIKVL